MKKVVLTLLVIGSFIGQLRASGAEEKNSSKQTVKQMWDKINRDLRIPSRIVSLFSDEKPVVHFTVDSLGKIKVLEIESASPLLERQLRRSFEDIQKAGDPVLSGQRYSIELKLN